MRVWVCLPNDTESMDIFRKIISIYFQFWYRKHVFDSHDRPIDFIKMSVQNIHMHAKETLRVFYSKPWVLPIAARKRFDNYDYHDCWSKCICVCNHTAKSLDQLIIGNN